MSAFTPISITANTILPSVGKYYNGGAADYNVTITAGLGIVELFRGSSNNLNAIAAAGVTITGVLGTTIGSPRIVLVEVAPGVYRGDTPRAMFNPAGFSMIGDSRSADLFLGSGKNSRNWLVQACIYYKQTPIIVGNYGTSSLRSDQYLTNGKFESALADSALWLIFGYPAVNDLSQAGGGFTDTFGTAVTSANVVANTISILMRYAQRAVAAGKRVLMLTEPGSSGFTAAQTALVHEFNKQLKLAVQTTPGIFLYDPCPLIWSPTGSTTTITKKTGFTGDTTHAQQLEADTVGYDFATNFLPAILPLVDTLPAHLSDTVANGSSQLWRNPLFNTLTGGTTGGNITLSSGTVPLNCAISGSTAMGLSVAITSAANANGFGNDLTLAITATDAGDFRFDLQTSTADWALTDTFESRLEADIAAGSTALGCYFETYIQTDSGTKECYDAYAGASGPMSTAAKTALCYRTLKGGVAAASTSKTAVLGRYRVAFASGGGTVTVTLRRGGVYRYS